MDTPVADVVIGEGCNIGANCCIVGVTRKSFFFSHPTNIRWLSGAVPVQPAGRPPTDPDGKDTRLNGKTPHRSRAARRAPPAAEHRPASHHRRRRLDRRQRNNLVSPSRAAGPRRHPVRLVPSHAHPLLPLSWPTPTPFLSIYPNPTTTNPTQKRGNITIGSGAVIGACSLVTTNIPPMTLAYGSPARVVSLLSDIKPRSAAAAAAATTALTLDEALQLANRLPLDLADDEPLPVGQGAGFDCGLVTSTATVGRQGIGRRGYVCEGDARREVDGVGVSRRRVSVGSSAGSSSTVAVESLGVGLGREREVRELLRERGRQHRVMRRFEVEALAVMTIVVALLVAFFLAGLYLGARRVLVFG